mmetsp:Transcript_14322/g.60578  ORF Transcript_14322/g.60578 Transcript_14322/m.60578 type:complete len:238 (-) Transcript_14322:1010-1723(-)
MRRRSGDDPARGRRRGERASRGGREGPLRRFGDASGKYPRTRRAPRGGRQRADPGGGGGEVGPRRRPPRFPSNASFQLKPRGSDSVDEPDEPLRRRRQVGARGRPPRDCRARRAGRDARGAERRRGRGGGAVEQGYDRRHPRVVVDARRGRYPPAERGRRARREVGAAHRGRRAVLPDVLGPRRGRSTASRAGRARLFTPRASAGHAREQAGTTIGGAEGPGVLRRELRGDGARRAR